MRNIDHIAQQMDEVLSLEGTVVVQRATELQVEAQKVATDFSLGRGVDYRIIYILLYVHMYYIFTYIHRYIIVRSYLYTVAVAMLLLYTYDTYDIVYIILHNTPVI